MLSTRSRDARFVVLVWVVSRAWLALCAYAGHRMHPFLAPVRGGYSGVSNWWLNVWTTYDSTYFIEIAQRGYRPLTTAFFPLYPLLLRPFGPDENDIALAGILISNVAFLIALAILLQLGKAELGEHAARRSTLVLAFFPSAIYSMAVYTDALFLMLALLSFLAAREKRWAAAGLIAGLAALTRNAGPVLTAALAVEWVVQRRRVGQSLMSPSVVFVGVPVLVFVAVQLYFSARFGRVTLLAAQASFGRAPSMPWTPIIRDVMDVVRSRHGISLVTLLNVGASCAVFVIAWIYRSRLAARNLMLMCGVMLMQLSYSRTWPPYTISSLRYVLSTPAFADGLALMSVTPRSRVVQLGFAIIGVLTCGTMALLFGMKAFIS
ncbi:MAG: glycosyltransferase family 39 protein [Gemmatimonadaceae bacterium]|nr:glycosyltransferase family 39 protein [Gemmatimonadaceae bacterium]